MSPYIITTMASGECLSVLVAETTWSLYLNFDTAQTHEVHIW